MCIVGNYKIDVTYFDCPLPCSPFIAKAWDVNKISVSEISSSRVGCQSSFKSLYNVYYTLIKLFLSHWRVQRASGHAHKRPTNVIVLRQNRCHDKLADSSGSDNAKRRSASGGFVPWSPDEAVSPWTPLGTLLPHPRCAPTLTLNPPVFY